MVLGREERKTQSVCECGKRCLMSKTCGNPFHLHTQRRFLKQVLWFPLLPGPSSPKVPVLQSQELMCLNEPVTGQPWRAHHGPASHRLSLLPGVPVPSLPTQSAPCSSCPSLPTTRPNHQATPHSSEEKPEAQRRRVGHWLWPVSGGQGEGKTSVSSSYSLHVLVHPSGLFFSARWLSPLPGVAVLPEQPRSLRCLGKAPRMLSQDSVDALYGTLFGKSPIVGTHLSK